MPKKIRLPTETIKDSSMGKRRKDTGYIMPPPVRKHNALIPWKKPLNQDGTKS
jgi:hypothetical protein